MKMHSPHWDESVGSCTKHRIPEIPCPACVADNDPDIEVTFDDMEHDLVAYGVDGVEGYGDLVPKTIANRFH